VLRDGIDIRLTRRPGAAQARRLEPVTVGVPLPRGAAMDSDDFSLWDAVGHQVPAEARVLDRWSDESIRWLLLDAHVSDDPAYHAGPHCLRHKPGATAQGLQVRQDGAQVHVDTGRMRAVLAPVGAFPFTDVTVGGQPAVDVSRSRFSVLDEKGTAIAVLFERVTVEHSGTLRAVVAVEGQIKNAAGALALEVLLRIHFFAGSTTARWVVRLRNPRKAEHPDGYWDLGSAGSVLLEDCSLQLAMAGAGDVTAICSPEIGAPFDAVSGTFALYQDSSGGENWKSSNHVSRKHDVPNTFRGYRMSGSGPDRDGLRATPILALSRGRAQLAVCVPVFWQNFPKAIEAAGDVLTVRLFPQQYADVHEIQGGEQKTHELFVAFGRDTVTDEPLAWCRQRLLAHATPEWYAESGAVPYLTPSSLAISAGHRQLVDAAIEGPDTFEHKREVVDEYGWRHFGDVYGDHEGVRHTGPTPLVSHYNNQYDVIGGFATQFLRSGDVRWWAMMEELAAHVVDIDIYHSQEDKWAYTHGLFWHTYHYGDADTATHRSYPRAGAKVTGGGGPSADQNYTSGLMLHYFLTGDVGSRDTVIDSAQYVIDLDDGSKSVFRWLDRGATGLATASGSYSYHGPGRSPANSVNALLDGYRLTGRRRYIDKADELVRRVVHPAENIADRDLGHIEMKWFYTMFLQVLGKYLDDRAERGHLDAMYAYGRASLLHYARWMLEHERPYLDQKEKLEFPTETWAAQDIRKSDIFYFAARYAAPEERARFLEQAVFYYEYAVRTLASMPTKTLARPVVVMLSHGWLHAWFSGRQGIEAPPALTASDFGSPQTFVPQKIRAMKRAKLIVAAGGGVGVVAAGYLLLRLLT
jgi:PcRGLX-like N-terminal RIFT barrel domain/PcRGLX-like protein central beta sandwich domain